MSRRDKGIAAIFALVFFLFIGAFFLGELSKLVSKLVPDNAAIQSLKGTYEFLVRLFTDLGSPDPTLLIILILIVIVLVVFHIYAKSQQTRW
jgi:hypothetical protein